MPPPKYKDDPPRQIRAQVGLKLRPPTKEEVIGVLSDSNWRCVGADFFFFSYLIKES